MVGAEAHLAPTTPIRTRLGNCVAPKEHARAARAGRRRTGRRGAAGSGAVSAPPQAESPAFRMVQAG